MNLGSLARVNLEIEAGRKRERMKNFSDMDGLVEGIGQELKPVGPQTNAPMQPQDGQWTIRFNYADVSKVFVFVTVTFGAPFALTAELSSEMNESQVENLKSWLTRVLTAMNKKPTDGG
jgi:hypothetical protein